MRTKWLKYFMSIGIVLMLTSIAYAVPSAPALPLTLDGTSGAITWFPATVTFVAPGNVIDYYEWELRLNGASTPKTARDNTTVPPNAATFGGTYWSDNLDNGSFGPIAPLGPGRYQLAVRAYDLDEAPYTVQGDWQTLDLDVPPSDPDPTVSWEVEDPNGTYTVEWASQTGVEQTVVEWKYYGESTWNSSGTLNNADESYIIDAIDPLKFWKQTDIRVTVTDTDSGLFTVATTSVDPVPFAPTTVNVIHTSPDWVINFSYGTAVDPQYFIWKITTTFAGSVVTTSPAEILGSYVGLDTDLGTAAFNPVTNAPSLGNIFSHDWVFTVNAWGADGEDLASRAAAEFQINLSPMGTITMTSAADANPWKFHVVYTDPYNDLKWGTTPGGYLDFVNLLFDYLSFGWTEAERPAPSFGGVGEIDLEVDPGDLTEHAYYNKYRNWAVTARPGLSCDVVSEDHLATSSPYSFTTVCPPFDAPQPGNSEYFDGSYLVVPEYGTTEQGVSSGAPIRTTWTLPDLPVGFYGNTDYLRSFVDWDVSLDNSVFNDFALDTRWFGWDDNREDLPNRTNLTSPSGQVRFYNVHVNMQYDNFGDGMNNYVDVSSATLIDQFEVDNQNPGPATGDTIVQDMTTMTYGNPWVFNFTTPDFPDFEQYRAQLTKSGSGAILNGSLMVPEPPNSPETWTVTEDMWDNQAAWVSNPFGTYNFYVDTYDNTVPDREMYDDPIAFSFPYTVYEALGEVKDLLGVANHVSIEYLYMDRVRAGWQAVNHKPFGLDPNRIHYVAELEYYNEALTKWLLVDETDEVYQYDPLPGNLITSPNMYADFNAGDYDFPAGQYRIRVKSYYDDPFTTDVRGDGLSDTFNIDYKGVTMAAPTWDTGYANILWADPTTADPVLNMDEYEVMVAGTNGLLYTVRVPAATLSIPVAMSTWWPDANVYGASYVAYVRGVDNIGRWSDWSAASAPYPLELPKLDPATIGVYMPFEAGTPIADGTLLDPSLTEVKVKVDEPVAPGETAFINWDRSKVTYVLRVRDGEDADAIPGGVAYYDFNTLAPLAQNVPVGYPGKHLYHVFQVMAYYDGVALTDYSDPITIQVDLKAPAAATDLAVDTHETSRPMAPADFDWDFTWTGDDDAVKYDLIVSRLSSQGGAVDAVKVIPGLTTEGSADFRPDQEFSDRVYGYYKFEVVSYDERDNSIVSGPVTFSFGPPSLTVSPVTLSTTQISWTPNAEQMLFDVRLEGDNGLNHSWSKVAGSSLTFDLEDLFPGENVYTSWTAYVRAYDRDGNVGAWFTDTMPLEMPYFSALNFNVYTPGLAIPAPTGIAMNVRDLYVRWDEYNTKPDDFINWDKSKVTFQLKGTLSNDVVDTLDVVEVNNGHTSIQVPVGIQSNEVWYSFEVDMFYDGVKVTQTSPVTRGYYHIDLKAPPVPTDLDWDTTGSPWTFEWVSGGDDTNGYIFILQKRDPVSGLVINEYTLDLPYDSTIVNPLQLNWSVFGDYWWTVRSYDQFRNISELPPFENWLYFSYSLDPLVSPTEMSYMLVGEEKSELIEGVEYSSKRTAIFSWDTPDDEILGIKMKDVHYWFELMKRDGAGFTNVVAYPLTWLEEVGQLKAEVTVGNTGVTTEYKGRVRAEYRGESTDWVESRTFFIDLERPYFEEDAEAPTYSSTEEELPSWLFTWDEAEDEEVGLGGYLFILERLEGSTTHALAMIELPVEAEEGPGGTAVPAYEYENVSGTNMLTVDPSAYVTTIDGTFRYTVIPYDKLDNIGEGLVGEFRSLWSGGDEDSTYPFINLYDNWKDEIADMGWVNNNTYATVSFDIYGLEGYKLEFRLNGAILTKDVDYMLLESPYSADMHYLVLLESVRDMMQAANNGDLEIYAYVEEGGLVVKYAIDLFDYHYKNERTGFGFGRFRPAVDPGFDY